MKADLRDLSFEPEDLVETNADGGAPRRHWAEIDRALLFAYSIHEVRHRFPIVHQRGPIPAVAGMQLRLVDQRDAFFRRMRIEERIQIPLLVRRDAGFDQRAILT